MSNSKNISIAKLDDLDEIMQFIDNEWEKGHILGTNRDFFLYEYQNKELLNFVISKNQSNKINGILGFLKSSSDVNSTLWTTMWKVSKSTNSPMLGIEILNFLRKQDYNNIISVGINLKTIEIYKYLGFKTGVLEHYFIPNHNINKNQIAIIPTHLKNNINFPVINKDITCKKITIKEVQESFNFNKYKSLSHNKDLNYFKKRYFQHPIYKYDVYGSYKDSKLHALLVVRISSYLESSCIRIVDFYGEAVFLDSISMTLVKIMHEKNHEYIDFLCSGLSSTTMLKAGFIKVNDEDVVIPNYFEPFVRKNIFINFFTGSSLDGENLRIFKADGDQDRPSSSVMKLLSK